jgi:hypothetical protein
VSVQFLLDTIRLRYESQPASANLKDAALQLSKLLTAMLLASLSNKRSISQSEHDISACIGVLSDCALGRLTVHVVLSALTSVLAWCEILPIEAAAFIDDHHSDDERKMQVASRLGRNMLVSQFHDVVAPVLLSRTVFSGDNNTKRSSQQLEEASSNGGINWEGHWRQVLLLFSWVGAIAGPEGITAAKSTGSLLLASGLAGSMKGVMIDANSTIISALFLPPPALAQMIGNTSQSDWRYSDILSERLQIMMPLLPGIVVSLLGHPSYTTPDTAISTKALTVLAEVLTCVGGAFQRVFGLRQSDRLDSSSEIVKSAKAFVPHLLVVAMLIENHIALRSVSKDGACVAVQRPQVGNDRSVRTSDSDFAVDFSFTTNDSSINEVIVALPEASAGLDNGAVVKLLHSSQYSVLSTAVALVTNAMSHGGSGAALSLWQNILTTLEESVSYSVIEPITDEAGMRSATISLQNSSAQITCDPDRQSRAESLASDVLCRIISLVITKAMNRRNQWQVWSYELGSAVSKVCLLIEEKKLLREPRGAMFEGDQSLSDDQVALLFTLLELLSYGRDATGWCQLALPAMNNSVNDVSGTLIHDPSSASKLLLPALQPCLRVVLECLHIVSPKIKIEIPSGFSIPDGDGTFETSVGFGGLLAATLAELDPTLTAAIVGLSFSTARDLALNAMTNLRTSMTFRQDPLVNSAFGALFVKIAEELRVRYEGERRLRENALFDAYDDGQSVSAKNAAEGSQAVESLILGHALGSSDHTNGVKEDKSSVNFFGRKSRVNDDFLLFHSVHASSDSSAMDRVELGYAQYEGLGATLEGCRALLGDQTNMAVSGKVSDSLAPYLDSWEASRARDCEESEFVELFGSAIQINRHGTASSPQEGQLPAPSKQPPILGSESAADAMSAFFEFAAVEKARLSEISQRFLPGHRHSRMSYAERFCWAQYMEFTPSYNDCDRGVPDGNRDVRSRLPTVPCGPQFRRYIPKYLDHYSDLNATDKVQLTTTHGHGKNSDRRRSSVAEDMDALTKTLLESGNLAIVDITKKTIIDEDDPELDFELLASSGASHDDDDAEQSVDALESAFNEESSDLRGSNRDMQPATDDSPNSEYDSVALFKGDIGAKGRHSVASSAFATPPDNASSSLHLMNSAAAGMIEMHLDSCLHVRAEGSRPCTVLLTASHLVLEYEGDPEGFFEGEVLAVQEDADRQRLYKEAGESKEEDPEQIFLQRVERQHREVAAMRPKSIRYNLSEVSHIYLRRYRLRDSALEVFFIPSGGASFGGYGLYSPSTSLYLDFGSGHEGNTRRDDAAFAVMQRSPPQAIKQWPDRSAQFLHDQLSRITIGWVEGRITNFDYLLHLNLLSGRSYNDICQYPGKSSKDIQCILASCLPSHALSLKSVSLGSF